MNANEDEARKKETSTPMLINFLVANRKNRGAMAECRAALVLGKQSRSYHRLARFYGIGGDFHAKTVRTISGIFGSYAESSFSDEILKSSHPSFGATCRNLLSEEERNNLSSQEAVSPGACERRFMHLLSAREDEIFDRVVRFALRAQRESVAIGFTGLFYDLKKFFREPEAIRKKWGSDFWCCQAKEEG